MSLIGPDGQDLRRGRKGAGDRSEPVPVTGPLGLAVCGPARGHGDGDTFRGLSTRDNQASIDMFYLDERRMTHENRCELKSEDDDGCPLCTCNTTGQRNVF